MFNGDSVRLERGNSSGDAQWGWLHTTEMHLLPFNCHPENDSGGGLRLHTLWHEVSEGLGRSGRKSIQDPSRVTGGRVG